MTYIKTHAQPIAYKYDPKFYVEDTNGKWVDFSDRSNNQGVNRLLSVGVIKNRVEIGLGALVTTIQNVVLRNNDGYFNQPFPSTLKTTDNSTASFDVSKGYKRPLLKGRKCKIAVQIRLPVNEYVTDGASDVSPMDIIQEETLGVFFIEKVLPDVARKSISLKLISQDGRLNLKDAGGIKYGYDYFENRSVSFLIEEILKSEYASDNALPSDYSIAKNPFMDTIDDLLNVSNLGRPPLWDGSNWRNDGLYTRALCFANVNSTGNYLYLGCDEQLWKYSTSTGIYTSVDTSTIPADYHIKKIFYDDDNDQLVVMAWKDEQWNTWANDKGKKGWAAKIYIWNGAGSLTLKNSGGDVYITSLGNIFRPSTAYHTVPSYTIYIAAIGYLYNLVTVTSGPKTRNENVFIPFSQHINYTLEGYRYEDKRTYVEPTGYEALECVTIESQQLDFYVSGKMYFSYVPRGHVASYKFNTVLEDNDEMLTPLLYRVGQEYCPILSNRNVSADKYVYYFQLKLHDVGGTDYNYLCEGLDANDDWDNAVWFKLCSHNLVSAGAENTVDLPAGLEHSVPLCMAVNGSSDKAYVILIKHQEGASGGAVDTLNSIYSIFVDLDIPTFASSPFGTVSQLSGSESDADKFWTPINIRFFSSNNGSSTYDKCVIIFLNRSTGQYCLAHTTLVYFTTGGFFWSNCSKLRYSNNPFLALEVDSVDDVVYAYSMDGKIYKITKAGVLSTLNESPVIGNEFGLLSNLAVNQAHTADNPEIFGVSSPTTHLESYYTYLSGKYYLFRVSDSISDLVEYADFSGMTKIEAIKQLSQSRDGLSFFNREGTFYYISRPYSLGAADYTIGVFENGIKGIVKSTKLDYGHDRIYNVAKIKSYSVIFDPPKADALTLIVRTDKNGDEIDANSLPFVDYSIEQRDTLGKIVRAYCVKGGTTTDGESKWKYNITENNIEAIVNGDHTSTDTIIDLNSVFGGDDEDNGVHAGNFITVINPDTGAYITRGISAVSATDDQITISSAFGIALKDGTIVVISRAFQTDTSYAKSTWSDEGVTYVDNIGGYAAIAEDIVVKSVENLSIGTVVRFGEDANEYRITAVNEDDKQITIEQIDGSSGGLITVIFNEDVIYAHYSPKAADGYEIGGTNIFIKWLVGSGTQETDYTKTFIAGDRLVIECPGNLLTEDSSSLQVAVDGVSATTHGRNEFAVDNKFMGRTIAKEIAKRIVYYYADPKFGLKVELPLAPYIDIVTDGSMTVVDVQDPENFPNSEDFTESFFVISVQHNLKDLVTTLELIGVDAY